jgi:phosphoribosylformylglycinamidine synthase
MVVAVRDVQPLADMCDAYGVEFTDIGEFTGDGQLVVRHHGEVILNLDTDFLHNGRPQRHMQAKMPAPVRDHMREEAFHSVFGEIDIVVALKKLLQHPNIASKEAVIHRYDHEIRGATVVRPLVGARSDGHADGVVLAEPVDTHGLAIGIGVNPWFGEVDPERMALAVVDEAIRNVVAVGADPAKIALLDNFSWGDPRRETTLGHLVAAVAGCCTASRAFCAPCLFSATQHVNLEQVTSRKSWDSRVTERFRISTQLLRFDIARCTRQFNWDSLHPATTFQKGELLSQLLKWQSVVVWELTCLHVVPLVMRRGCLANPMVASLSK